MTSASTLIRPSNSPATGGATFLDGLRSRVGGQAVRPGDLGYDEARQVWNAAVDRRPALIVRAADVADVVATVEHARESRLPLAIRSGGHSLAGYGTVDGGIVLDLRAMRAIEIDPEGRTAWAQAGATSGEVTTAAGAFGLAVPFGDAGSVGLGGITLGGGIGWLVRRHGLTIDHLRAVELVTADGALITASANENPDLFWALRGGGGNFGVVTRFQYRLVPVDIVLGGALILPADARVIHGATQLALAAPEALSTIGMLMPMPPLPFVDPALHGQLVYNLMLVHDGDPEAGQTALAPFRALATPLADLVQPMPYPAIYDLTAAAGVRHASVSRSMFADDLDEASLARVIDTYAEGRAPLAMFQVRALGGAMARVAPEATAFAHRDRRLLVTQITPMADPSEAAATTTWLEALWSGLRPFSRGVYVNFLEAEGHARVREAYPAGTYERLARIKAAVDPTNLFALNQNIRPAGRATA